jgi:DNA polymerase III epsilon subunit family exonuclease
MQHNKNHKKVRELLRLYEGGAVFTAFDTETTGLSAHNDRLLEIGAVQFSKDGILATYSQLINPCRAIPYEASQINNITHDMVQDCPTEQDILPDFQKFIGSSILVAHNANFDLKFINTALERHGHQILENQVEDTVKISRAIFPELEKYRLQFLAQHFSINPGNAHRATDDARVCMEVLLRCFQHLS